MHAQFGQGLRRLERRAIIFGQGIARLLAEFLARSRWVRTSE
jgi:hypothetical protein